MPLGERAVTTLRFLSLGYNACAFAFTTRQTSACYNVYTRTMHEMQCREMDLPVIWLVISEIVMT